MTKTRVHEVCLENYQKQCPDVFCKKAGLQLYLKRDSGTGVFLWILRNFKEYLSTEHLKTTVSYKKCVCFETLTITYYLQKGNTSEKANETMYSRFITWWNNSVSLNIQMSTTW